MSVLQSRFATLGIRLVSCEKGPGHRLTIPKHKALRFGTLNNILKEVAACLELDYSQLIESLFGGSWSAALCERTRRRGIGKLLCADEMAGGPELNPGEHAGSGGGPGPSEAFSMRKQKPFDCVEMKQQIQAELPDEKQRLGEQGMMGRHRQWLETSEADPGAGAGPGRASAGPACARSVRRLMVPEAPGCAPGGCRGGPHPLGPQFSGRAGDLETRTQPRRLRTSDSRPRRLLDDPRTVN